jgi:hypothetical protein
MASKEDERVFLVAMSRLASNHTGTRAHLQRINVVCQCAMGYDTIDYGLWECELHCALRKTPDCRDGSHWSHFLILKRHGSAHLVKCLRDSSDPLDTGSNPNIHLSLKKKKNLKIFWIFFSKVTAYHCKSINFSHFNWKSFDVSKWVYNFAGQKKFF